MGRTTMCDAAVNNVELLFIRREAQAIGLHEIVDDDGYGTTLRVDAKDIVLLLFLLNLEAFVVSVRAIGWIAKPDRSVGGDHHIIGRVDPLAIVAIRDDGDRAVVFSAHDAPTGMLAADQPALGIKGVAGGVVRRRA